MEKPTLMQMLFIFFPNPVYSLLFRAIYPMNISAQILRLWLMTINSHEHDSTKYGPWVTDCFLAFKLKVSKHSRLDLEKKWWHKKKVKKNASIYRRIILAILAVPQSKPPKGRFWTSSERLQRSFSKSYRNIAIFVVNPQNKPFFKNKFSQKVHFPDPKYV